MASLENLKQRKQELLERIKEAEQRKKQLIEPYIRQYDNYIFQCNSQLQFCNQLISAKTKKKNKTVLILICLIFIVLIAILISLFFILPVGKDAFTKIGEKISSNLRFGAEEIVKVEEKISEVSEKEIVEEIKKPEVSVVLENKDAGILSESLIQYQAVLGKNVKWIKKIVVDRDNGFSLTLPAGSENVKITKIEDGKEQEITYLADVKEKRKFWLFGEKRTEVEIGGESITGKEVAGEGLTGKAISNPETLNEEIEFEIEFETPAPQSFEEILGEKKRVTISAPDALHYENIFSFTRLPEEIEKQEVKTIKLYEIKTENGKEERKETEFNAYDTDENSLLDFIEWVASSDTTYELVIEISKAEHLDENRSFISDIYPAVFALDGNWSEVIENNEYVRVTFSQQLDNTRDITIYPRIVSGEPRIEVYEQDKNEKIAEFTDIKNNTYNKVYLTNLQESQNVFDLRIINGSIEIDYIVDPYTDRYYFIGGSSSGDGDIKQLSATQGTGTAKWSTTTNKASLWFITQFAQKTNITSQSFAVTFWCNKTGTARGERIRISQINIYDCGTSSSCLTQTPICTTSTLSLECNYNTPTKVISTDCTSTTDTTLDAGDYFGLKFVVDLNKVGINLYFNSSTYPSHVNITKNQAPQVTYVSSIPSINPLQASYRTINFNVTVYDANVASDINDTSVRANFSRKGAVRQNLSCAEIAGENTLTSQNYSCSIDMWYFDEPGNWNITVYAEDLGGLSAINNTATFQYNELKAIEISPSELNWPEILSEAANQTSSEPTVINNTGNYNATGKIAIYSSNLYGTEITEEYIDVGNFTVGTTTGPSCPEACSECAGTKLANGTDVLIIGGELDRGNLSAGQAREQLYYCIKEVPSAISAQTYSTKQAGSWIVKILSIALIIKKTKKKNKRKINKTLEKDSLVKTLISVSKELKVEYSENKKQIISLLKKEIKKKYRINNKELSGLMEIEKDIPITIFSKELGALEVIVKYMKENLSLSYKEISELLYRNERTIWTAYNKAKAKQPEPIKIKETPFFLPISIFSRKLTILEAVILHLKKKQIKNKEIAFLLSRDQRNISTIYAKAVKKQKSKV